MEALRDINILGGDKDEDKVPRVRVFARGLVQTCPSHHLPVRP